MILTCPACDTKYVVKDGAIPAGGRQVRCASCKHSWHQEPEIALTETEAALVEQPSAAVEFGSHPAAGAEVAQEGHAEIPPQAGAEAMVADEPQPRMSVEGSGDEYPEAVWQPAQADDLDEAGQPAPEARQAEPEAVEWQPPVAPEEEFLGYAPIAPDDEEPRRRWPMLIGMLILIVAAAAAFWFLAPAEWKARAGIAGAGATPLQLMITNRDRQVLESGNELVAISGRVINPTDAEQRVPPIRAELRDSRTKALVHSWTIAAPAQVLAPRSSASFNSAEVDVPKGGDELTVTLGG